MPLQRPEAFRFIQRVALDVPGLGARPLTVAVYHASGRRTGRRAIVEDGDIILFDSGNCYDLANASNSVEQWVLKQLECVHCGAKGLTDGHGQDAESGLPICSECCAKASGGRQTASMSASDLAVSVAALAEPKREAPGKLAAVAVDEVGDDDGPEEFPF